MYDLQYGKPLRSALQKLAMKELPPMTSPEPRPPQRNLSNVDVDALLKHSLKPEEISGEQRELRVRELLRWFSRLTREMANPKWTVPHAYELAYYIATSPPTSSPLPSEPQKFGEDAEGHYRGIPEVGPQTAFARDNLCPTCGTKLIPAAQAFSEIRERITAEEPPAELNTLIDALMSACREVGYCLAAEKARPDKNFGPSIRKGKRDADAARAALVALFAEKERVLASAGGEIYDLQKSVASLSSQLARQQATYEAWGRAFSDEELSSMQEQNNWNDFEARLFKTCQRPSSQLEQISRFEIEWLRNVVVVLDGNPKTKPLAAKLHERVESWLLRLSQSDTGDTK